MKRTCFLVMLMVLASSAHAGSSLSFSVGGHRVRIEAPKHCRSASCLSVSIPGIRRARDDEASDVADQVKPPVAVQQSAPVQATPPATYPAAPSVVPPAVFRPAAAITQAVAAPPRVIPPQVLPPVPPPPPPALMPPAEIARPAATAAPRISEVAQLQDEPVDSPVGDWQSEGNKGTVRIERCGAALCGYALKSASDDKGEAVLVNMKPKAEQAWTGSVYSRSSGDTYYGTMALKGANTLRVEACALGRFYCTGNNWSRIVTKPERLVTQRQISSPPGS